jgi:hypothetical protein
MKLTNEQKLLLFAISHQYVLLNNDGDVEDDVKRALCGTFNANKIDYKIPDLAKDIAQLEETRMIEKNFKEKRFDLSIMAKNTAGLIFYDEKRDGVPTAPPEYNAFMKTFWVVFCSFLKGPLVELIRDIYNTDSKQISELKISSDIAATVLCDLAVKRGFVVKDANGLVTLTENGITMIEAVIEEAVEKQ